MKEEKIKMPVKESRDKAIKDAFDFIRNSEKSYLEKVESNNREIVGRSSSLNSSSSKQQGFSDEKIISRLKEGLQKLWLGDITDDEFLAEVENQIFFARKECEKEKQIRFKADMEAFENSIRSDSNKKLIEEIKQKMEFDFNNQTSDWHEYGYLFVSKTDWEKFWKKLKGDKT